MNTGPWLPIWLLGAPLVLAIIDRLRTPKTASYTSTNFPSRDADANERGIDPRARAAAR